MAVKVGEVMATSSGVGFTISDDRGHNSITVSYKTDGEARVAREQVRVAFANAIDALGPPR